MKRNNRPDHDGPQRQEFERNKKKIFMSRRTCGICGGEVDFSIPYPEPMSACIDHIIPVSKGGHPSDLQNLQLAHRKCNREKSDRVNFKARQNVAKEETMTNRNLPQSRNWTAYRSE